MIITVEGDPVGKGRPRFTKQGRAYTPKATKEYEAKVRREWIDAGGPYLDGEIQVRVDALFKMPSGWSKKKRAAMDGKHCTKLPDADNILKAVLDGLQGAAFENDKAVVRVAIEKWWSQFGCAVIDVDLIKE